MNFYIDKPTLSDIPAMRNLVLPEVQKGIILDRSEDEMAGVIRSYSVIRVVDSAGDNSVLGMQFRTQSAESALDSAPPSPLSLDSFSQKGLHPPPRSPYAPKSSAFSLLGREPRFSASSKKSAGGTSAPFDSDCLHHEAGEFSGASHGFNADSANLQNSQNLVKNNPCEAQPLKASSGQVLNCGKGVVAEGEGSDFAIRKNPCIQAPAPSLKKNACCEKGDFNADLSAQGRKENRDSSVASLSQNDKMKMTQNDNLDAESSLDSAPQDEFGSPSKNPIIAFAALQILSLTLGEVRSLIVDEKYRRNGLATMLIEHLLAEARALNLKEVLALTYQREVFEKLGFKEIAKESLPNQKIWADCIKCKKFPVCDEIALTKIL